MEEIDMENTRIGNYFHRSSILNSSCILQDA